LAREATVANAAGFATVILNFRLKKVMDGRKISRILALTVSAVMVIAGIAVLAGVFLPPTAPKTLRLTLGIVFLLMGAYRFLMTRLQAQKRERFDE